MAVVGIDHVQLAMPVGEEARARAFYGELLGLREVAKPEPLVGRGGCWFEGPAVVVHLGVQKNFVPARKAHPAFLVSELSRLQQQLELAGFDITNDGTVEGVQRCYLSDPFGNRIELIQDGQGFSQGSAG